jgi:hypothetical protein
VLACLISDLEKYTYIPYIVGKNNNEVLIESEHGNSHWLEKYHYKNT